MSILLYLEVRAVSAMLPQMSTNKAMFTDIGVKDI
jgi:hypothetical protein